MMLRMKKMMKRKKVKRNETSNFPTIYRFAGVVPAGEIGPCGKIELRKGRQS